MRDLPNRLKHWLTALASWSVIKLKVGKGVCPSRAQQYSSNAAMVNSNTSGSPDAATCLAASVFEFANHYGSTLLCPRTGTLLSVCSKIIGNRFSQGHGL